MTPSNPIVANAIAAMMAMVAMLALAATPVAAAAQDAAPAKRGIGWLYDYCDDDWAIMPPYYFTGKCNVTHPEAKRDWLSIDLTGCYTVTDDGFLAVDNAGVGGMDKLCDRCSRCTFLEDDVCMMCSCSVKDGSYKHWAIKDLDDDLRVDWEKDRICCGEWWGGPYCGFRGKPPKPAVAGQINYLPTLWP
ncbi:hypothetical protein PG991_012236 [Apiospora marii]|uniref:Cyanovirin-N domain-containing protein n=1 Tax=Apiospora marii TaxID=335849 RepID=A0ABR1R951_9PEZI